MRALRCATCIVLTWALSATSFAQAEDARAEDNVGWLASIPMAQRIAADSQRLVLVHFWSPSCKPCMRLDTNVYNLPTVGRAIQREYIPVKVNADFSPTTATQYGVTSLPTDVILTPAGQVIAKYNPPMDAGAYMEQLGQIFEHYRGCNPVANAPPTSTPWNASSAAPAAAIAATQSPIMPTAGTQPINSGLPATASSAPLFTGGAAPAPPATPTGAPPMTTQSPVAPATAAAQAPGAPNNTSPYSNDRYADYLRQRGVAPAPQQPAVGPQQVAATPTAWQPPAGNAPNTPAAAPATSPVANAWGAQAPANPAAVQPSMTAQPPVNPSAGLPPGNPPLALDGYCPVRLREEYKWVLGDRRFGAIHRGRTYLFTSQAEQQKFLANPDLYSPVLSGNDPVLAFEQGQQVPGQRKLGVFYGEGPAARIYMFSSDDSLKRFWENPERYAGQIRQAEAASRGPIR